MSNESINLSSISGKYKGSIADGFLEFLCSNPKKINKKTFHTETYSLSKNKRLEKVTDSLSKENIDISLKEHQDLFHKETIDSVNPSKRIDIPKTGKDSKQIKIHKNSYFNKFIKFQKKLKKGKNRNAKSKFKFYLEKRLKELYNVYLFSEFAKTHFVDEYFNLKDTKNTYDDRLKKEKDSLSENKNKIINYKNKNKLIERDKLNILISLDQFQDFLEFRKKKEEDIISNNKEISVLEENNKGIVTRIDSLNTKINEIQNNINFLIAQHRENIIRVPIWNFIVKNIEIDFNDGFIEHITVSGNANIPSIDEIAIINTIQNKERHQKYSNSNLTDLIRSFFDEKYTQEALKEILNKEFKFENEFPIGFSSKTDFADLDNYELFAFEGSDKVFSLPLTNVIDLYIQRHQNDRLDFSPKDQVVRLPLDDIDQNNEIELKKEKSSKILNAKIYTDFNGLKENEPNGLVQIEVEKEIPLWTKRMPLGLGRSSNIGFANYAKFNLTWAKLNDEDREVQVNYTESFINNELNVDKYVTYLDLIRYENVSVGVDLNVASLDFPLIKTRLEINAGAHYGRLKVVDTLTNSNGTPRTSLFEKDVNMIRLYPDVIVRIRPEERFGGYLRFRPFRTIVPNNEEFFSVSSEKSFQENRVVKEDWLNRYELGLFYTPSANSDNKFFFRYRYTNTFDWETNGYSELQLGYLVYLRF